jgi:hypothetical protein
LSNNFASRPDDVEDDAFCDTVVDGSKLDVVTVETALTGTKGLVGTFSDFTTTGDELRDILLASEDCINETVGF